MAVERISISSVDFKTFRVKILCTFREPIFSHLVIFFTAGVNFHIKYLALTFFHILATFLHIEAFSHLKVPQMLYPAGQIA